jgi:hypothetical protein
MNKAARDEGFYLEGFTNTCSLRIPLACNRVSLTTSTDHHAHYSVLKDPKAPM